MAGAGGTGGATGTLAPAVAKYTAEQVETALAARPEWSECAGSIQRTFRFKNFVEAMAFVNKVAAIAEEDQHHPDILIRYNKVTISVNTHDAGGITVKDFHLAQRLDALC